MGTQEQGGSAQFNEQTQPPVAARTVVQPAESATTQLSMKTTDWNQVTETKVEVPSLGNNGPEHAAHATPQEEATQAAAQRVSGPGGSAEPAVAHQADESAAHSLQAQGDSSEPGVEHEGESAVQNLQAQEESSGQGIDDDGDHEVHDSAVQRLQAKAGEPDEVHTNNFEQSTDAQPAGVDAGVRAETTAQPIQGTSPDVNDDAQLAPLAADPLPVEHSTAYSEFTSFARLHHNLDEAAYALETLVTTEVALPAKAKPQLLDLHISLVLIALVYKALHIPVADRVAKSLNFAYKGSPRYDTSVVRDNHAFMNRRTSECFANAAAITHLHKLLMEDVDTLLPRCEAAAVALEHDAVLLRAKVNKAYDKVKALQPEMERLLNMYGRARRWRYYTAGISLLVAAYARRKIVELDTHAQKKRDKQKDRLDSEQSSTFAAQHIREYVLPSVIKVQRLVNAGADAFHHVETQLQLLISATETIAQGGDADVGEAAEQLQAAAREVCQASGDLLSYTKHARSTLGGVELMVYQAGGTSVSPRHAEAWLQRHPDMMQLVQDVLGRGSSALDLRLLCALTSQPQDAV